MNLLSIDLEYGAVRAYVCTPGSKPKQVYRNDLPNYDRGLAWDLDELEAFRLDPVKYVERHSGEAA
jgi:uncharacterized protein with ParB-like and HNH nuclease domain